MGDSFRIDAKFLRSCILYDVLQGKGIDEIYKVLCQVIGKDAVEYIEIDYWYYRFYNGSRDLDYDRKLDLKAVPFSDLPTDIIVRIVEKLDLKGQLNLRKVSRDLRTLVDEQKPAYDAIECYSDNNHIHVKFNDDDVVYINDKSDEEALKEFYCFDDIKLIKQDNYEELAFNDMASALKNPKIHLDFFRKEYSNPIPLFGKDGALLQPLEVEEVTDNFYNNLETLLKSLNHKIPVKRFSLRAGNQEKVLTILPYLKAGVLESIEIDDVGWFTYVGIEELMDIDQVVAIDQWKQAQELEIINWPIAVPIEHFMHFKRFDVLLDSISIDDLIRLRDTLSKSTTFETCCLNTRNWIVYADVDGLLDLHIPPDATNPNVRHYQIPNSKDILEFYLDNKTVLIERHNSFYPEE